MSAKKLKTSLLILVEMILILGLTELGIMAALNAIDLHLPSFAEALLDASLLCLIVTPILFWRIRAHLQRHASLTQEKLEDSHTLTKFRVASAMIFLLGTVLSLILAWKTHQQALEEGDRRFERNVRVIESGVQSNFEKAKLALQSLVGIYAADGGFNSERFRAYWSARDFTQHFPSVRGFGVIERVPRAELSPFLTRQRREGATDFRLKTSGRESNLYVITMVEPIERNRAALGLDISREGVRLAGAQQALRSGRATLTGVINLVQDERQGPGFLLLIPLYAGGRVPATEVKRESLHRGFVYCPITAAEVLGFIPDLAADQVDVDVYAEEVPGKDVLVYATHRQQRAPGVALPTHGARGGAFSRTIKLTIADRSFRLQVVSTAAFDAATFQSGAIIIGLGGIMLSGLLSLSFWLLASGRVRAEARAKELSGEMKRLALVAERTNNSVIIADADNRIVWVNDAFTRLSGQPLDEVQGRRASDVRGRNQDPEALRRIHEALREGRALTIETVNQARDGHSYWVDLDLQPLHDDKGHYNGYVAVERDITAFREAHERDRRHAEQLAAALREGQALMDTINAHAIVSEADPGGRIVRVNDAFCEISGYDREELIGQDHRIVNSGAQSRAFWTQMWQTIASGKPWRGQICNRRKDGTHYWVDSIIAPFVDASGRIERYVSIRFDITEARRAEEALAMERQRLEHILEGTNIGTWRVNLITGENAFDQRWAAMLGYELAELLPITPQKWQGLVHEADELLAQERLRDYVRGVSPYYEVERRLRHKNGGWIWVLSRGTATSRLPDGRMEWLSGTHMDVTERHTLYEEIERRTQLMTAILENMPGGVSAFDADLHLILKNRQFVEMLDFPDRLFEQSPVTYQSLVRYEAERGEFGPVDVNTLVERAVMNVRRTTAVTFERVRPSGQVLEVRVQPMGNSGVVMNTIDITQRREAEREARQADEMLRQAINTLDEAFVIYDGHDRLLICNQRYRDTYPIAAAVMQPGATFEEIVRYGAERGEYAAAVGRVDEWVAERVAQHQRADSDLVQELGNGRFLRIVERKTTDGFIVGFRIDITDLVRARMAAEEASKSKSQFLANMSHEIRTPMNAILGMLDLLDSTELSVRQRDYVQKTHSAAESLLGLLNDILDFSKVEAGKMTLEEAPLHLDQLLRDLSVILSSNAGNKPVEVLFDVDPKLPDTVLGDSLRLKQILINLGGNAIKFTEQGTVVVRITVLGKQPGRVTLGFSVQDTGIGIAPEHLQRIFEGFAQAEASTTRRFGGTGLGLAISARLVGMMGGQLRVESELGKGSRFFFHISLPVLPEEARVIAPPLLETDRALHVLIIDDNPLAQQVLCGMVEALGWHAECANSGEDALKLIRERLARSEPVYDAVFVDWKMPGMDGWETSLQIRHLLADQGAPILVMVTAYGREMLSQRPAAEQALLNGFLVKPVTPSMVLDAVLEARHGGKAADSLVPAAHPAAPRRLLGMRVLVVEDNKINQQIAQELLQREGAQVTLADDGELGVQAISAAHPPWDVVLMDVQMPVMDGYAATRKVRETLGIRDLPIIAMTANAMESDRQDALAAGMNDHVGKPFKLANLVATILRHTGHTPPLAADIEPAAADAAPDVPPARSPMQAIHVAGLDVDSALRHMGGDAELLARISQAFATDLPRRLLEFDRLVAERHQKDAARLLHTLKGTAATVGAMQLSHVAAEGERRLREGNFPNGDDVAQLRASLQSAAAAFRPALDNLLQQLQAVAPARPGAASLPPADDASLQTGIGELLALLRNSDLGSLDAYKRLQERQGGAFVAEFTALGHAMECLDFAEAVRLCEALLQRYTGATPTH